MKTYAVEGLAPLVFRSGKPFGAQAGADGSNFPLPSSAAGLIRTLHADQHGIEFAESSAAVLRDIPVCGPLLAKRSQKEGLVVLLPKPADAVYMDHDSTKQVLRLSPKPLDADSWSDLRRGLTPVQMENQDVKGKPCPGPQFWPLDQFQKWEQGHAVGFKELTEKGLESLSSETRTHVGIEDESLAAESGLLFQTSGFDLGPRLEKKDGEVLSRWSDQDHVFLVRSGVELDRTLATFGGERRLSRLSATQQDPWPKLPKDFTAKIQVSKGLRLTLATPAIFSQGDLPGWLDRSTLEGSPPDCPEIRLRLVASACNGWMPVSGWDLLQKKPKAMRKACNAGTVLWFEVLESTPSALEALWMSSLSDHPQDRRDGFGLCLMAPWSPLQSA